MIPVEINLRNLARLIILFFLLQACAFKSHPPPLFDCQETLLPGEVKAVLANQYPSRVNALHHVRLKIRGKEMVLKGFVKVDRPRGSVHLIAQGEMGGTLFEVRLEGGKTVLVKASGGFKKAWLENSVARDLAYLYLAPVLSRPGFCETEGRLRVVDREDGRMVTYELMRGDAGMRLSAFKRFNKGETDYSIDYGYGARNRLPAYIKINNREMGYALEIHVRYMIPRPE